MEEYLAHTEPGILLVPTSQKRTPQFLEHCAEYAEGSGLSSEE